MALALHLWFSHGYGKPRFDESLVHQTQMSAMEPCIFAWTDA